MVRKIKKTYNWVGNFIPYKSPDQPGILFSLLINLDLNKDCNFTQSRSVWKICDPKTLQCHDPKKAMYGTFTYI